VIYIKCPLIYDKHYICGTGADDFGFVMYFCYCDCVGCLFCIHKISNRIELTHNVASYCIM
jgi:hypothetical protein